MPTPGMRDSLMDDCADPHDPHDERFVEVFLSGVLMKELVYQHSFYRCSHVEGLQY